MNCHHPGLCAWVGRVRPEVLDTISGDCAGLPRSAPVCAGLRRMSSKNRDLIDRLQTSASWTTPEEMSSAETGQMSAVETRQMYSIEIGQSPLVVTPTGPSGIPTGLREPSREQMATWWPSGGWSSRWPSGTWLSRSHKRKVLPNSKMTMRCVTVCRL